MKLRTKFQDEDFRLGEVVDAKISDLTAYGDNRRFGVKVTAKKGGEHTFFYESVKEFTDMWEDYEEPKEFYIVENRGIVGSRFRTSTDYEEKFKEIGNYFETEEEAEKAVEKLKAWKRLKDAGFSFTGFEETDRGCLGDFTIYCYTKPDYTRPYDDVEKDLDLIFGGEE